MFYFAIKKTNWPLAEPKKLKERFDKIFGTSTYNKAIEKIEKHRVLYKSEFDKEGIIVLSHF